MVIDPRAQHLSLRNLTESTSRVQRPSSGAIKGHAGWKDKQTVVLSQSLRVFPTGDAGSKSDQSSRRSDLSTPVLTPDAFPLVS